MAKYVDLTFSLYDGFPNYPILPRMEFKKILEIGVDQSPSDVRLISMPTHGGTHFYRHLINSPRSLHLMCWTSCDD